MEVTYEIHHSRKAHDKVSIRRYNKRQDALDAWDVTVDSVLPGDKAELRHVRGNKVSISSSYAPCDRNHPFLPTGVHGQ